MDALQWMGAVRMRAGKNITIMPIDEQVIHFSKSDIIIYNIWFIIWILLVILNYILNEFAHVVLF